MDEKRLTACNSGENDETNEGSSNNPNKGSNWGTGGRSGGSRGGVTDGIHVRCKGPGRVDHGCRDQPGHGLHIKRVSGSGPRCHEGTGVLTEGRRAVVGRTAARVVVVVVVDGVVVAVVLEAAGVVVVATWAGVVVVVMVTLT